MATLYIGDSHGRFDAFNRTVEYALSVSPVEVDEIVSVGDFGFWPRLGYQFLNSFDLPIRFIDGNHEDHLALGLPETYPTGKPPFDASHIPRATLEGNVFYHGGGTSIDAFMRIPDRDWFEAENISYPQFNRAIEIIEDAGETIGVMVCHDTISSGYEYLSKGNKRFVSARCRDANAEALESMWEVARPRLFIHGHHHVSARYEIGGCTFVSLDRCCRGGDAKAMDKQFVIADDEGNIIVPHGNY